MTNFLVIPRNGSGYRIVQANTPEDVPAALRYKGYVKETTYRKAKKRTWCMTVPGSPGHTAEYTITEQKKNNDSTCPRF